MKKRNNSRIDSKRGLLVVSFGTSYEDTRKKTIEAIEKDLAGVFADRLFYRAWTSRMIMKKVKITQGLNIDNPEEALERMKADGITDLLVVPAVLTAGGEYHKIIDALETHRKDFENIHVSTPLLSCAQDVVILAKALEDIFGEIEEKDMLALMGHGSESEPLQVYMRLDASLKHDGFLHFCVGTVEFEPGFEPVLYQMREQKPDKVYLAPLMLVAGDHALNDLVGEKEDSWQSLVRRAGFETESILKGLGEYPQIRALYVRHAIDAAQ